MIAIYCKGNLDLVLSGKDLQELGNSSLEAKCIYGKKEAKLNYKKSIVNNKFEIKKDKISIILNKEYYSKLCFFKALSLQYRKDKTASIYLKEF